MAGLCPRKRMRPWPRLLLQTVTRASPGRNVTVPAVSVPVRTRDTMQIRARLSASVSDWECAVTGE